MAGGMDLAFLGGLRPAARRTAEMGAMATSWRRLKVTAR